MCRRALILKPVFHFTILYVQYIDDVLTLYIFVWQSLKLTESEKLQVQIQAYLDNVLDVGALLEDAENRGGVLDHVNELQDHNVQVSAPREKK